MNALDILRNTPAVTARPHHQADWHAREQQALTLGERAADRLRNGMGSWTFVGVFLCFMLVWAVFNTVAVFAHWDPYPFILLNLFLSMLAGLQGAILLIAAKRSDAVSAALAQHDFEVDQAARKDVQVLLELNRKQVEMLGELHERLCALERDAPSQG
ncbi:DUF1003 domain-containing protein [Protaetiibacter intestinalis]|nr:DUF1003 domain-containing protein [Protaetiibacter intestinalis]